MPQSDPKLTRKRKYELISEDTGLDETAVRVGKRHNISNTDNGLSAAGTKRQKKSERKPKKQIQAELKKRELSGKPTTDELAVGADFVSLGEVQGTNKGPRSKAEKEEKRARSKALRTDQAIASKKGVGPDAGHTTKAAVSATQQEKSKQEVKSDKRQTKKEQKTKEAASSRFIVFVGNLPFTTTTEQIQQHFAKLNPSSIRHSTDKATGKSKGFAFVEFSSVQQLATALKLYHHSIFDPRAIDAEGNPIREDDEEWEKKKADRKWSGRKINVELTAGGGGKGKNRREKIQGKNQKLADRRGRELEKDKLKKIKEREEAKNKVSDVNQVEPNAHIHPSRLSRMKG